MPVPWTQEHPLMLAPMQGLTNRALRGVFAQTAKPDVLFTEFVRVRARGKGLIAASDYVEALATEPGIPLVVQVIGSADEGVLEATRELVERGVEHINVNMGCPFGRMTSVLAGGGMFRYPETVEPLLAQLRELVPGTLSVKTRTGIDGEREIFEVLPAFENAGVDFVIVHARTVLAEIQRRGESRADARAGQRDFAAFDRQRRRAGRSARKGGPRRDWRGGAHAGSWRRL